MNPIASITKKIFFIITILFSYSAFYIPHPVFSSSLFTKDCTKENKEYVVKQVFDGDTILVETLRWNVSTNALKIRLLGIDAFELEQNQYGKTAKDFLTKLVLNKKVCVETDIQEKDIYERTLGYVFLKDVIARSAATKQSPNDSRNEIASSSALGGFLAMTNKPLLFINEELLKSGNAILYDFPPDTKYISRLKKAQIYARQNMLGIWKEHDYILETPSQWRHKHPFKK